MALKEIKIYPDPVLRKTATKIDNMSDEIVALSDDMIETMRLANGAGLAANQVGVALRLIVIDEHVSKDGKAIVLINPEVLYTESEEASEEGCLSVPKFFEFVRRPKRVRVRAVDLRGEVMEIDCEDQLARALQHEIDHLNGILFVDHLSPLKREFFKKKFMRPKR
jgi:peptide deformylase